MKKEIAEREKQEEELKWEDGEEREILIVIDMKALKEKKEEPMTDEVAEFKNSNVKVIYKKIKASQN